MNDTHDSHAALAAELQRERKVNRVLREGLERLAHVDMSWAWNHEESVADNCERLRATIARVAVEAISRSEKAGAA